MPRESATPRRTYHHGSLREALLDAGLELTRTGGPSGLVLRDVTRRVGVSPNAAYRHFDDRDSLLDAVATRIQQNMVAQMGHHLPQAPADGASAARARLTAVGLGYIAFAIKEPGWFEVAFADIDALPVSGADDAMPAPLRWLVDALDQLVDSGELTADAREGAEWPCWSAVHGFALLVLKGPLRSQPPELAWSSAERTVAAIITGLLA